MKEFIEAFRALRHAPRGLWLVIWAFCVDAMAYFGVLTLMTTFLHEDLALSDFHSGLVVSGFTGAVTVFMLFAGPLVEKRGIRKGIIISLVLAIVGRGLYVGSPILGKTFVALIGLLICALGEGLLQPVAYSGIKQYTDEKTSSMGYAMLYAVMNFTIVVMGAISPVVRVHYDGVHKAGGSRFSGSGMVGWVCFGITLLTMAVFIAFMSKKVEAGKVRDLDKEQKDANDAAAKLEAEKAQGPYRVQSEKKKFLKGPFADPRFMFFIFMLLPVRTLFAHQWLTLPGYVLRAYDQSVADRMEWIVNWINPGIIFFGAPILTALTKKQHVYKMMIIGTMVSAVPTFMLCAGPSLALLIAYLVIFSIGEALWSSRFLEYASELAPPGRTMQYMGIANIPWFIAKVTTGLYSGWMLNKFCPENGAKHTEYLWLIYGSIALISPIGLIMARRWAMATPKSDASDSATPA